MSRRTHATFVRLLAIFGLCLSLTYGPVIALQTVRAVAPPAPARSQQPITKLHKPGELIVKFKEDAPRWQREQIVGAIAKEEKTLRGRSGAIRLKLKDQFDVASTLLDLRQLDRVIEYVEPNYLVARTGKTNHAPSAQAAPPNDPLFAAQWALQNTGQNNGIPGADIGALAGWATTTGLRSTIVAVIDTGVDVMHPDLARNLWRNEPEANGVAEQDDDGDGYVDDVAGWNFVGENNNVLDDNGHGTTQAGLIAAEGNNGVGIAGALWGASILPLKALNAAGLGTTADVAEAIDFAVAHGAGVISCSFGTDGFSQFLLDAINRAAAAGVLVVASAGNDGRDLERTPYYPASYQAGNLIAVGATTNTDELADFSNWSATSVQVAAPGTDVLTTQAGGGYVSVTGTSAAAPLVAGLAGLLKTLRPWVSAQTVRQSLINGSRPVPGLAGKVASGGVVNAGGAVTALTVGGGVVVGSSNPGPGDGTGGTPGGVRTGTGGGDAGSGVPNLDYMREQRPARPEPRVSINTLPPSGYDDPQPTQTGSFNSYYTELTKAANATGVAGSKPLQTTDPTAGTASVGGVSINLDAKNFSFTAPVLGLAGRAGLNLGLALTYNSRVWTKDPGSSRIFFNADKGFPGPGWRVGFGAIQGVNNSGAIGPYTNGVTGKSSFLYLAPDGTRRDLAYNSTSGLYESYDSSYIDFNATSKVLRTSDGTQVSLTTSVTANGDYQFLPAQIKDRNGNYISITYRTLSNNDVVIDYITDTAGRQIDFYYQSNRLIDIRQDRAGTLYKFAILDYEPVTVATNFTSLTLDPSTITSTQVYLPTRITYPSGANLRFYYTSYAQMYLLEKWAPTVSGQGTERRVAYTRFNLPSYNGTSYPTNTLVTSDASGQTDNPRFTTRAEQAENWQSGTAQDYTYAYTSDVGYNQVTDPLGRKHRASLSSMTQTFQTFPSGSSTSSKTVQLEWQQDSGLSYQSNARPLDRQVTDGTNSSRTHYTYTQQNGMWLPTQSDLYKGDLTTMYSKTLSSYTSLASQHILGLPQESTTYGGTGQTTLMGKFVYNYDETGTFTDSNSQSASYFIDASGDGAIQHDNTNYGASFTTRGNLTSITQHSMTSSATRIVRRTGYDTNGNVRHVADGAGNRSQILYTDNYSNQPTGIGQTAVYPYTTADPTGFRRGAQYDYYHGGAVKSFILRSGSSSEELAHTQSYDFADRPLDFVRPDTGYTSLSYWDNWLQVGQYQKFDRVSSQDYVLFRAQGFDGAGRVRQRSSDHPDGIASKYSGQQYVFDAVGRPTQTSNAIAINSDWTPRDEDATPVGLGWIYTTTTYDELNRPTIITRPDSNTVQYSYAGCGCAGGLTTTVTDERGKKTQTVADFAGRLLEARELNAAGTSTYSKAAYVYDEMNRLTQINHSGTTSTQIQTRSFAYDGYSRKQSETTPEGGTMSYTYKGNDLVETTTDARGKVATYTYNTRNLPTGVSYNDSGATPSVSFGYDEYGMRDAMTDGEGSTSYTYGDNMHRLTSEARTFTGLSGNTYTINYTYNYGDMLTRVNYVSGFNKNINYAYTRGAALAGVGTNLIGTDANTTSNVITSLTYRGFGGLKGLNYGTNPRKLILGYNDQRQQMTSMVVQLTSGSDTIISQTYDYNNGGNNNGRIQTITDGVDSAYTTTYGYDDYNRLTAATATAYTRGYTYDEWGNLKTVTASGGGQAGYTINYATNTSGAPSTNRISNVNGTISYSYDSAGNLTQEGSTTYSYDAASRLKEVGTGGNNTYGYDGDGHRVRKVESGGAAVYYVWSTVLGQVAWETKSSQAINRAYVYGPNGKLLAQQSTDGQFYWVHTDHLGSGRKLTNSSGTLKYRGEFDPHGQALYEWSDVSTDLNSKKFTGYERDAATGLDYARARTYHSGRGRFMQADQLSLGAADFNRPQTLNRYAYTSNDPVNFVDPTGLDEVYRVEPSTPGGFTVNVFAGSGGQAKSLAEIFGAGIGGGGTILDELAPTESAGYLPEPQDPAQQGRCEAPTWDELTGPNGIINQLLNPLGIEHTYANERHNYSITQQGSFRDFTNRLTAQGWERFSTDPHPDHWGMDDYRKQYQGEWYHLSIGRPQTYIEGAVPIINWDQPATEFSIHWEEAKPGGVRHFINFLASKSQGIGIKAFRSPNCVRIGTP